MPQSPSSDEIVSCGRSWIGTRFAHQGRLKKTETHAGGVDCLGLLIGVAKELDIKDANGAAIGLQDTRDYTRTPDTKRLYEALLHTLQQKPIGAAQAGDIVLLNIQNSPQHLGILSTLDGGTMGIIHAYAQARKVVEHALDGYWRAQLVAVFRLV